MTFAEMQPPFRIVERGRGGKYNRIRMLDTFGGRSWSRRKAAKAMRRLRSILEEGRGRGKRASVESS